MPVQAQFERVVEDYTLWIEERESANQPCGLTPLTQWLASRGEPTEDARELQSLLIAESLRRATQAGQRGQVFVRPN